MHKNEKIKKLSYCISPDKDEELMELILWQFHVKVMKKSILCIEKEVEKLLKTKKHLKGKKI